MYTIPIEVRLFKSADLKGLETNVNALMAHNNVDSYWMPATSNPTYSEVKGEWAMTLIRFKRV